MCTNGNQIYTTSNGQQVITSPTGTVPSTQWTTVLAPSGNIKNICYNSNASLLSLMNDTSLITSTTNGASWSTTTFINGNNIFYFTMSPNGNMIYCIDTNKQLYFYNLI